jgi:hypothetical protein
VDGSHCLEAIKAAQIPTTTKLEANRRHENARLAVKSNPGRFGDVDGATEGPWSRVRLR